MENSINELRAVVMRAGDKWTATGLPRVAMVRSEACADEAYEPMPQEVALLAPIIEREILFRVLQKPQGDILRQIARTDSRLSQVCRAIDWIRLHFVEPFRADCRCSQHHSWKAIP